MSLDLINAGAEPNDGTGDPPRVAALKINANFETLAAALGETETTAQLNARDTANRARSNHTGTQAAATITGLATVATSGAYGDLSGKPTLPFGFAYDQQAEPISPSAGQTWRERSGEGQIIDDWEWVEDVALWLSIGRQRSLALLNFSALLGVAATAQIGSPLIPRIAGSNVFVEDVILSYRQTSGTIDGSNFWTVVIQNVVENGGATTPIYNTFSINTSTPNRTEFREVIDDLAPTNDNSFGIGFRFTPTGSPGPLRVGTVTNYRMVRV